MSGDDEISFYKEGQEQYPVKIRVLENQRGDISEIGRLTVPSANGPVRIDNIARLERGLGPTTLQRSDRQFTVQLIADVAPGHALDEASNDVRRMLAGLNMPSTMSFKLQGQSKILDETTANMIMAIGLAMIFVYMVLASQFESFLQPVVIMLVLPISVPFALFTLWATGRTLNLWSALGMLLLLGIVKKNSILQVDYANVLRSRGVPLREAIVESCRTRLRPILMTTTAIIAGLIPTSLGLGHRRHRPRGDRRHDHRRAVAVPVPDAAAGAGGLREVRRARAGADRRRREALAGEGFGSDHRPPASVSRVASGLRREGGRAAIRMLAGEGQRQAGDAEDQARADHDLLPSPAAELRHADHDQGGRAQDAPREWQGEGLGQRRVDRQRQAETRDGHEHISRSHGRRWRRNEGRRHVWITNRGHETHARYAPTVRVLDGRVTAVSARRRRCRRAAAAPRRFRPVSARRRAGAGSARRRLPERTPFRRRG